jgi:hypothetical protein
MDLFNFADCIFREAAHILHVTRSLARFRMPSLPYFFTEFKQAKAEYAKLQLLQSCFESLIQGYFPCRDDSYVFAIVNKLHH